MLLTDLASEQDSPHGRAEAMAEASASPRDVLVVVHRPETNPGAVGQWLRAQGYRLDIRCPRLGCPLPETLERHAGAVIFGGPMSANDPDDYIRREIDWIGVPLAEGKPYLGICLGAQMLAMHLGARVGFHPEGRIEVGFYPIAVSEAGRALLEWPEHVYHWHCEGFDLPCGAERLATGATFENQAIRYGAAAYGVQFHPEMTLAMIHRWTTTASHRFGQPGARPRAEHIQGHDLHGPRLRKWLHEFMTMWVDHSAAARRPAAPAPASRANGRGDMDRRGAFEHRHALPG